MWRSPRRSARSIKPRQPFRLRRLDLAAHLPQFRRNPVEAERARRRLPRSRSLRRIARLASRPQHRSEHPVLVQLEPEADRTIAKRDVVRLRAGEVLQGGAAAFGRHQAQIRLEAAREEHARLRVATPEHALHQRVADEIVHQRLIGAGGEEVEIAAGFAAAPQAADRRDRRLRRTLAQIVDERGRGVVRIRQEVAPGVALALLERLQDERLLFRAHAAQRADASVGRRALEIVERADAELAVQRGHGLGSDALQVEQIEDGRRKLGERARDGRPHRPLPRSRGFARRDPCRCPESRAGPARRARRAGADGSRRCRRRCDTRES